MPDAGFVFSGEETPNWGNGRRAGVAQSVAQLSCKQQVRGSSPLASSKCLVRPVFLFWILNRPPGNPQLSDPIVRPCVPPARRRRRIASTEDASRSGTPEPGAFLALPIWIVVLGNRPTPWPS
jgi:hypothetical protein